MITLDCRNMACPAPVISAKRALEEAAGEPVEIFVDAGASRENVTRFARSRGCTVVEREVEGGVALLLTTAPAEEGSTPSCAANTGGSVMLISSDRLGDGPEELGRLLMKNFIITLLDVTEPPEKMLFLNSGVLLTTAGSEVLEALEKLAHRGVEVLSCGVCLDYFHRRENLCAGSITNMLTIAESLTTAARVVRL